MEQLTVVKRNSKCRFCGINKNDYLRYGPIYKLGTITAHYYCVLLSNQLIQNGKDHEGILGFLLSDIEEELRRTSNILCIYCKKANATILCSALKCKKSFHLPCGLKNGSSHQFRHQFKSFCHVHRLVQQIPRKILREACENEVICCICQEKVDVVSRSSDTLWAPCCLKTWYHRNCVQKLAHSAGYFCRCPACNDSKKFNEWIQNFGIFIPQQDASWELIPNAFDDLLSRYNNCDAEECKCPGGRQSSRENTRWEIILCDSCGSQGVHVACGKLKFIDPEWECDSCRKVTQKMKSSVTAVSGSCKTDVGLSKPEVGQRKRRRNSEDLENSVLDKRKKCRISVEEEDFDIDVETVDEETTGETSAAPGRQDKAESCGRRDSSLPVPFAGTPEPSSKPEESTEAGKAGHGQAEEGAATTTTTTTRRNDPQEVLSLIKPGPLSFKLSAIRKLLGDYTVPKTTLEKQREREKATKSSSSMAVIELSDSEEDSDIDIINEVSVQTTEERSKSIFRYGVKKDHADAGENEQRQKAETREEGTKQQFSLQDFEVVAIVSLQLAEEEEDGRTPRKEEKAANLVTSNCFLESVANNFQKTAAKEDKELMQAVDDDVIILTD